MGTAPLLFVGINPRVSNSNRHLHNALMCDPSTFLELAGNRFHGQHYIGPQGLEGHYSAHVRIARQLFPDQSFETIAAVTELFFCASESAKGLPAQRSPCATKYFERVLALIQPKVVFAVGSQVESYLVRRFGSVDSKTFVTWGQTARALMIVIPHPNQRGERLSKWQAAAESARAYLLADKSPGEPSGPYPSLASDSSRHPTASASTLLQLSGTPDAQSSTVLHTVERPHLQPFKRPEENKAIPKASYRSTRLHFKRKFIEPLKMEDTFEIVTANATWRMTKADFYRVFPNVLASESYSGSRGEYFYPNPPPQARPFQVR
jgi:hypothetical protein